MCVKSLNHGFFRAIGLDDHVNRFSLFFYQRPCFVWEILRPYPVQTPMLVIEITHDWAVCPRLDHL